MPLINCGVNLILTWSRDCVITNSTGAGKFKITEAKLYVPVVTLSTPRAIQQVNFTENLDRAGNTAMFFIIEEAKETVFDFSLGNVKVL